MATDILTTPETTQVVTYNITEGQIAATRDKCALLTADTPQGYEEVRLAIGHLRNARTAIEKRRVELKADALRYGRLVDSEAQRFTGLLEAIEEPLKVKKAAVDDEKARVKAEADAAKLKALEDEIRANQERQEAERKAVRDAEEARIAADRAQLEAERQALAEQRRIADAKAAEERAAIDAAQRVERERLEAERAKLAEDIRAEEARQRTARKAEDDRLRVEREAIEAQRRAVEVEREKAGRAEFERLAKVRAEAEAVAKVERDRLEAAERQARIDALRPDLEKVRQFAQAIRNLAQAAPKSRTKEGKALIAGAVTGLGAVAVAVDAEADRWK